MPNRKTTPVPVALDDALLSEIDIVAAEINQNRSAVIRSATRAGLAMIRTQGSSDVLDIGGQFLVRKGGSADVVQLDGPLSTDVAEIAKSQEWPRQKVLVEAIRAGLETVHAQWKIGNIDKKQPDNPLAQHPATKGQTIENAPESLKQFLEYVRRNPVIKEIIVSILMPGKGKRTNLDFTTIDLCDKAPLQKQSKQGTKASGKMKSPLKPSVSPAEK